MKTIHGKILVDDDDYEWVKKLSIRIRGGYPNVLIPTGDMKYFTISLHRVILKAKRKDHVDHINGNPLDNRKENLRICTKQQNDFNRKKPRNNTSGYKGVSLNKYGKYASQIGFNNKTIHIGSFDNPIDAARAYNEKAKELHGEFAYLNILPDEKF